MSPVIDNILVFLALGEDEQRVLVEVARRLAMGAKQYGPLDIDRDSRDWCREAAEEAQDLAVYLSCLLLRKEGLDA